jgi:streptogramin lyase
MVRHFGGSDVLGGAIAVMLDEDGIVHALDYDRGQVVRFDPITGGAIDVIATGFAAPVSLDLAPDGALCVLDAAGIHRLDATTGERLSTLVRADDGHLAGPRSFTFVAD